MTPVRLVIAEDTLSMQAILQQIFTPDQGFELLALCNNGRELIEAVARNRPDVIITDLDMPVMDGVTAIQTLRQRWPDIPILVFSNSFILHRSRGSLSAADVGATDILFKPPSVSRQSLPQIAGLLRERVRAAASARPVPAATTRPKGPAQASEADVAPLLRRWPRIDYIAIGTSTGGPQTLRTVLGRLPKLFRQTVLVTQHMDAAFMLQFADWLDTQIAPRVRIPGQGERLRPAHVYVAPGDVHMTVEQDTIRLSSAPPEHSCRPAADPLFRSLIPHARHTCALVLTGIGQDGALGLKQLREAGALTLAQDEDSSVVWGMPGTAVRLGAAEAVWSAHALAGFLETLTTRKED